MSYCALERAGDEARLLAQIDALYADKVAARGLEREKGKENKHK